MDKEIIDKLIKQCQHPRTVANRYTHELVTVPCGTCPACLLRKANLRTALLMNWASNYKYRMFVTLTYRNEALPKFHIVPAEVSSDDLADVPCLENVSPDSRIMYVAKQVPRTYEVKVANSNVSRTFKQDKEDLSFWFYSTPQDMQVYYDKVNDDGYLPCINYRDVDLFLKRLRSYYKDETQDFKYYCTAEYGPVHLRPHYHLLILTDSESVANTLRENVHKAWSYGRTDCEQSRGFSAGYVASYINNDVYLPPLYELMPRAARPQSHHSKGWQESRCFPRNSLPSSVEDVYNTCLDGIDVASDGDVQAIKPSWAYINRVFPRLSDSVRNNSSRIRVLLHATLTASARMCRRSASLTSVLFGCSSLVEFSRDYAVYASSQYRRYLRFEMSAAERAEFIRTDLYLIRECRLEHDIQFLSYWAEVPPVKDYPLGAFYRHFLRCRKFFGFWHIRSSACDSEAIFQLSEWIVRFWHDYEYKRVVSSYSLMESLSEDAVRYIYRMYSDCRSFPEDIRTESQYVSYIYNMTSNRIRVRCKHKELNDANNILFNPY